MYIGCFTISQRQFEANNYQNKFSRTQDIQVVAKAYAAKIDRYFYLVKKHKNPHRGSANFGWLNQFYFQSYADGVTVPNLKRMDKTNNPYFWIPCNEIRLKSSITATQNVRVAKDVLVLFREDD